MSSIGIDLGTTNSVISAYKDGRVVTLPVAPWNCNDHLMPSVVASSENGLAIYKNEITNWRIIRSVKRHIGHEFEIEGYSPSDVSAVILSALKYGAEAELGIPINEAVISVPAHFDNTQRLATKLAASIAGIKVIRLINEPTAAAIAYGLEKKKNGLFCVYDFGGGTFDFSVLRLKDSVFQVLAVAGDNYLGGDDIDKDIARLCCERYGADFDNLSTEDQAMSISAGRELKEGKVRSLYIALSNFTAEFYITADELKEIIEKYAEKTISIAQKALYDAELSFDAIEAIVMVGGMTKSSIVQDYVSRYGQILCDINPDEAVSVGAALYAESILSKTRNSLLIDVTPLSLGIETLGGGVDYIIPRNAPIPYEHSVEYTTAEDNQTSISFNIVQGEAKYAAQCRSIGRFKLDNIPQMPARHARVTTTFKIDVNGILHVTAVERSTGIRQDIVVEPTEGLSTDDYMRMMTR